MLNRVDVKYTIHKICKANNNSNNKTDKNSVENRANSNNKEKDKKNKIISIISLFNDEKNNKFNSLKTENINTMYNTPKVSKKGIRKFLLKDFDKYRENNTLSTNSAASYIKKQNFIGLKNAKKEKNTCNITPKSFEKKQHSRKISALHLKSKINLNKSNNEINNEDLIIKNNSKIYCLNNYKTKFNKYLSEINKNEDITDYVNIKDNKHLTEQVEIKNDIFEKKDDLFSPIEEVEEAQEFSICLSRPDSFKLFKTKKHRIKSMLITKSIECSSRINESQLNVSIKNKKKKICNMPFYFTSYQKNKTKSFIPNKSLYKKKEFNHTQVNSSINLTTPNPFGHKIRKITRLHIKSEK